MESAVSSINYVGGSTNTAQGLLLLRTAVFNTANGARLGFPRLAFVITDGKADDSSAAATQVDL